ncbi:MAG: hypothetical protein ACRD2P_06715 [Terriglobia bacterium]
MKITVDIYGHMIPGADIVYMDRLDRKIPQIGPPESTIPRRNLPIDLPKGSHHKPLERLG